MVPINYLAIIACGIVAVFVGFLWYGPLFGKPWRKTMGISDEEVARAKTDKSMQQKMMKSAAIAFVFALITAYVLQHIIVTGNAYFNSSGLTGGLMGAFWSWLGFAVPVLTGAVLWEMKTWKWWLLTISYYLVSWLLMGVILSLWV